MGTKDAASGAMSTLHNLVRRPIGPNEVPCCVPEALHGLRRIELVALKGQQAVLLPAMDIPEESRGQVGTGCGITLGLECGGTSGSGW